MQQYYVQPMFIRFQVLIQTRYELFCLDHNRTVYNLQARTKDPLENSNKTTSHCLSSLITLIFAFLLANSVCASPWCIAQRHGLVFKGPGRSYEFTDHFSLSKCTYPGFKFYIKNATGVEQRKKEKENININEVNIVRSFL